MALRPANCAKFPRYPVGLLSALVLVLSILLGPVTQPAMGMPADVSVTTDAMAGMDGGDLAAMHECCDERPDQEQGAPCENSMLCMIACGKLPVQTAAVVLPVAPASADLPARARDQLYPGQILSPPRRPPRLG